MITDILLLVKSSTNGQEVCISNEISQTLTIVVHNTT